MAGVLVVYSGDVQGVGFRATARDLARGFAVDGWVRNQADGTVALLASGSPAELEAFRQALRDSRLGSHISSEKASSQAPEPGLRGFEIRF